MTPSHPDLARLTFLFGTWKGQGSGRYPTINPFEYLEEASFNPGPDKPFVTYRQRTRRVGNGEPLHSETGYIRTTDPDRIELVIAQPIGIVEIHTGRDRRLSDPVPVGVGGVKSYRYRGIPGGTSHRSDRRYHAISTGDGSGRPTPSNPS